jgi:hypothetical protein
LMTHVRQFFQGRSARRPVGLKTAIDLIVGNEGGHSSRQQSPIY